MLFPSLLNNSAGRIFGLDVLRAFAILMVMVLHSSTWVSSKFFWFHWFVRHYDGVGIFFVLSGFLIGGILIKTLENRGIHLTNLWDFWIRRWIRTVPPYLLILLLVMPIELRFGSFPAKTYLPYFFFLQNFNWIMPPAFLESWSLTVEEWFYLLSAPSSFLFAKFLKPRYGVLVASVLFLVFSTAYRYYYFQNYQPTTWPDWNAHFRSIVLLRLDSLMYGVLAAWIAYYYPLAWIKAKWPLFIFGFFTLGLIANPADSSNLGLFTCVFSFSCAAFSVTCLLPLLGQWKQANGSRPMEAGQWKQANGSRPMEAGQWKQANGSRPMEAGQWKQANGSRPMEAGQWKQANGSRPMEAGQWKQANGSRPMEAGQWKQANGSRPMEAGQWNSGFYGDAYQLDIV